MERIHRTIAGLAVPLIGWYGLRATLLIWPIDGLLAALTAATFVAAMIQTFCYAFIGEQK